MKPSRASGDTSAAKASVSRDRPALPRLGVVTARETRGNFTVKQSIFSGKTVDGGADVAFVSLTDGRCALIRAGVLIAAWGTDEYGIDGAVRQYLELIQHPSLDAALSVEAVKRAHGAFTMRASKSRPTGHASRRLSRASR